ncbi:DUF58 domain-containing protein [Pseudarthrobacter sp. J1763]|uniref:DUF58 domain-containing protein n=1 Tax=Pseudarthrobacter sp. J1763 TaxID=3420445 RepID=UPI003D282CB0
MARPIRELFTSRGWGLLAAGGVALLAAGVMGRRDLLYVAVLLLVMPLISLASVRWAKPNFAIQRDFRPGMADTNTTATITLSVSRLVPGGARVVMKEQLPRNFGQSPSFSYPSRSARGARTSGYEYRLRSAQRGQFLIGPVSAEFADPFGLSMHRLDLDAGELLTVTPAAVELPSLNLNGARGNEGLAPTQARANPSDDDVMTREYRHGDPMRRVHWAATARHGKLMVRQEESVTAAEATLIFDQRHSAFATSKNDDATLARLETFEWAVVAMMSLSAHLIARQYALRVLTPNGAAGFKTSTSAPDPLAEEFSGAAGLATIAESLAAITVSSTTGSGPAGYGSGVQQTTSPDFGEGLYNRVAAHRMRGPLVAVLGRLSVEEAHRLAELAGVSTLTAAIIVAERPEEFGEAATVLRLAGWRVALASPASLLPAVWSEVDQWQTALPTASGGQA